MTTKRGSAEWKAKISAAKQGQGKGQNRPPFSQEWKDNIAKAARGKKMPPRSEEHRMKLSIAMQGKQHSEETKVKMRSKKKGYRPTPLSEESRKKLSESLKNSPLARAAWAKSAEMRRGKPRPPETVEKIRAARARQHFPTLPTVPEKKFAAIFKELTIPLEYVGNNTFRIAGVNPDFVDKSRKIAVEVFGDYFHTPLFCKRALKPEKTDEGRKATFKKNGWRLIIFWESELNLPDVKARVLKRLGALYARS